MPDTATDLRTMGGRIEAILDATAGDLRIRDTAEELIRVLTDLYGAGLARVVELAPPELVDVLAADELVGGLLLLHGLHPDGLVRRVEGALQSVRPLLGSHGGDVELLDVDEEVGAVRLRLLGSCDGCPSSASTLQGAVEAAVIAAAPEVVLIDVEEPSATAPPTRQDDGSVTLSIGRKPVYEACPSELVSTT